jgi:hypothetical protein
MILDEYDRANYSHSPDLLGKIRESRKSFDEALEYAKTNKSHEQFLTYHSRRLVEMTTDIVQSYLLMREGHHSERKQKAVAIFVEKMVPRVKANRDFIMNGNGALLKNYEAVIGKTAGK